MATEAFPKARTRSHAVKLEAIGEFGFIDRIASLGTLRAEGVVKGIGDDCAVISINGPDHLLVTTDLLVERVHFLLDWGRPEIIGAKSLSVNLSDIAACGGVPRDAFISLAVPSYIDVEWLDRFYAGMREVASDAQVNLLGGDTTSSKGHLVINVAVTGLVPRGEVLFRHTARPTDVIVLTGFTGRSAAGCDLLFKGFRLGDDAARPLIESHLIPRAHLKEGRMLAQSGACTAAIDVSDGLSSDLLHLCRDSGVAARVREESLPLDPALIRAGAELGTDPLHWVLHGGEDYVLLAAVRRERLEGLKELAGKECCGIFPIGEFVPGQGIELTKKDGTTQPLSALGWDHFR
jgi:thiamine-monophosphate kinase